MRQEIIGILTNIINEDVMAALIKRQDFYGICELLGYVDRLDDANRDRWIKVYNKTFTLI